MEKTYFHNIVNISKKDILLNLSFTEILYRYKQPDWCGKHEALNGLFGCNILLGLTGELLSKKFCNNCKEFKNE